MRYAGGWTVMVATLILVTQARAGVLDGMADRLSDRLGRAVENKVGRSGEQAVDEVFEETDDAIDCVADAPGCKAKPAASAPADEASVKCTGTDKACLRQAKTNGQKVEIVDEDPDTVRCSADDTACLRRARKSGQKVELTGGRSRAGRNRRAEK